MRFTRDENKRTVELPSLPESVRHGRMGSNHARVEAWRQRYRSIEMLESQGVTHVILSGRSMSVTYAKKMCEKRAGLKING